MSAGQKEGQSSRDPVLVAESWTGPGIYVPNLSHAETRSLKPSRAKVGSMRGVKQPLTLSRTTGVAISTWNKRVDETVGEEKDKSVN